MTRDNELYLKYIPVGKIAKKQSEGVWCHIVQNTLLQTAFSAIMPTGISKYNSIRYYGFTQ